MCHIKMADSDSAAMLPVGSRDSRLPTIVVIILRTQSLVLYSLYDISSSLLRHFVLQCVHSPLLVGKQGPHFTSANQDRYRDLYRLYFVLNLMLWLSQTTSSQVIAAVDVVLMPISAVQLGSRVRVELLNLFESYSVPHTILVYT